MIDDQALRQLLRASVPPVDLTPPRHDLWPAVVERAGAREKISAADLSVAAIVTIALLMFPKWFWFLAYHL
jgi:hypothetical protein